jgi:Skp family chaperone for outer membrane proteins
METESLSMKVAVVDLVRVLDESKEGLAGAKRLEGLFEEQQRELAPMIQQVKTKRDPKIEKQLETRAREHEQEREKMRVDLRNTLLQRAQATVDKIARERSVDFVLGKPQALLWAHPDLDLTLEVLKSLDV